MPKAWNAVRVASFPVACAPHLLILFLSQSTACISSSWQFLRTVWNLFTSVPAWPWSCDRAPFLRCPPKPFEHSNICFVLEVTYARCLTKTLSVVSWQRPPASTCRCTRLIYDSLQWGRTHTEGDWEGVRSDKLSDLGWCEVIRGRVYGSGLYSGLNTVKKRRWFYDWIFSHILSKGKTSQRLKL